MRQRKCPASWSILTAHFAWAKCRRCGVYAIVLKRSLIGYILPSVGAPLLDMQQTLLDKHYLRKHGARRHITGSNDCHKTIIAIETKPGYNQAWFY